MYLNLLTGPNLKKVYFSISISAYPKIDAANSKITTDYNLNLKWYDPRLIFRDLKADETFNDLSAESKMIIWSPKVDVPNALGQVKNQLNDDFTSVSLLKLKILNRKLSVMDLGLFSIAIVNIMI